MQLVCKTKLSHYQLTLTMTQDMYDYIDQSKYMSFISTTRGVKADNGIKIHIVSWVGGKAGYRHNHLYLDSSFITQDRSLLSDFEGLTGFLKDMTKIQEAIDQVNSGTSVDHKNIK